RQAALDLHPGCRPDTMNRNVITPTRAVILFAHDQGWCPPIRVKGFTEDRLRKLGHSFAPKRETVAIDWDWIDQFRANASNRYLAALALFMFTTGTRVGASTEMLPEDLNLQAGIAIVPPDKGQPPRQVSLVPEMVAELANLKPRRGKVFGYASRQSVYGPWKTTCTRAGIAYVPPHQAGRHSFATEAVTRQGVDAKTAMDMGGWKSSRLFTETYVHGEGHHEVALQVFGRTRGAK
ncbi:MAG: tyrosine-type recombinase/integrase, partial [Pseudomonadota bacterium]